MPLRLLPGMSVPSHSELTAITIGDALSISNFIANRVFLAARILDRTVLGLLVVPTVTLFPNASEERLKLLRDRGRRSGRGRGGDIAMSMPDTRLLDSPVDPPSISGKSSDPTCSEIPTACSCLVQSRGSSICSARACARLRRLTTCRDRVDNL